MLLLLNSPSRGRRGEEARTVTSLKRPRAAYVDRWRYNLVLHIMSNVCSSLTTVELLRICISQSYAHNMSSLLRCGRRLVSSRGARSCCHEHIRQRQACLKQTLPQRPAVHNFGNTRCFSTSPVTEDQTYLRYIHRARPSEDEEASKPAVAPQSSAAAAAAAGAPPALGEHLPSMLQHSQKGEDADEAGSNQLMLVLKDLKVSLPPIMLLELRL
jgi:hypothetical protein